MTRVPRPLLVIITSALIVLPAAAGASPRGQVCGWDVVRGPATLNGPYINDVDALSSSDIWAVGSDVGFNKSLTMHYDGSTWSVVPSPSPGIYNRLWSVAMIYPDDGWVVGWSLDANDGPLTMHWNGTAWTEVPAPSPQGVDTLLLGVDAAGPNDVWAVGYSSTGTKVRSIAEHWDGSAWSVVPTPHPPSHPESQLLAVKALAADDVWAVGSWTQGLEEFRTLSEHWDGTRWSIVPAGPGSRELTFLDAVDGVAANDLWAVGATGDPSQVGSNVRAQRWDGSSWTVADAPNPGGIQNSFHDVSALSTDDAWAIGDLYQGFSIDSHTVTEHWDGQSWTGVVSPNPDVGNYLYGVVAVASDDVWAVGYTISENGDSDALLLHYTCV